ncbi:tetratricopeptide repeat protein [Entomospira entomophila]|uniref:Tetratricopeptide repeat protein n=1 Tax=Entomospira entomophila TaxID=2719988 RepID=A0A968G8P6_9SPIO|nr:tetratricopeptide repeat protein [Entomospira entomophilus]NIZ39982.1 tetratricopeptide repeat protein [Entomospira entomophilus]WDI35542.1 tetratricopeptide repeat protein [Entomospira entomophilus]
MNHNDIDSEATEQADHCSFDTDLEVETFLELNGDTHSAEMEAKERKVSDWFLLGARSYIHNEYDLAITYFDKVLELEPENDRAYANRGDVYADKGFYEEAFNDYLMAAHLGGEQAQRLLDEFKEEMIDRKIMTKEGMFITRSVKMEEHHYWQTIREDDLGDDMHIVDLSVDTSLDDEDTNEG